MKRILQSPEQLLISLKLGKVVKHSKMNYSFKLVEGVVCVYEEGKCVEINATIPWYKDSYYVEDRFNVKGFMF